MSRVVVDSPGTPLRTAILHYFQWVAAASKEEKTGADKENTQAKRGHKVVAALLEEFPELEKFHIPALPQPELKVRFEAFPSQLSRIAFLENRIAFLEQHQQSRPLMSLANVAAAAPKQPTRQKRKAPPAGGSFNKRSPPKQLRMLPPAVAQGPAALATRNSAFPVATSQQQPGRQRAKTGAWSAPLATALANSPRDEECLTWDERYDQLVHFQKGYGHCRVPAKNSYKEVPGLGNWVIRQRANYRQNKLGPSQLEKLNKINFEWAVKDPGTPWEVRYEELKEFQRENGHCRVPRAYKKLGEWVHNQRQFYRNKAKCIMETGRLAKLQAIGFEFVVDRGHKTWDERFQQLVEFRREHGHIDVPVPVKQPAREKKNGNGNNNGDKYVPRDEESRFQSWVVNQRTLYRKYKNGDRSALTHYRFKKLDEIGFGKYETSPGGSRPDDDTWNVRLGQLRQYKDEFGDCNVPVSSEKHKQLGEWVKRQRKSYRALLAGKSSSMTPERKLALENLGIQWNLRPWMLKENREKTKNESEMKDNDENAK